MVTIARASRDALSFRAHGMTPRSGRLANHNQPPGRRPVSRAAGPNSERLQRNRHPRPAPTPSTQPGGYLFPSTLPSRQTSVPPHGSHEEDSHEEDSHEADSHDRRKANISAPTALTCLV